MAKKVVLRGTCSECFQVTDLILTEKTTELVCPTCGHSVPALEAGDRNALARDQGKKRVLAIVALAAFALAALLFYGFIAKAEPPPGAGADWRTPGAATGMLVGSIIMLLVSLVVGFMSSDRSYVCEF